MHLCGGKTWKHKFLLGACILGCCLSTSLAAESVTGVVRNLSNDRPAAGDEVLLIDLVQGAQEQARARTNAQGAFTLELHNPGKPHLIRVVHQGVNYDQQISAGNAISINVADATATVMGITGSIEIIRVGSHGGLLHVSDMVDIRNVSNPPVTQVSERTFEVYLPADAKIDSVLAAGPENSGTMIHATPVPGKPGHYSVNFPLRPGATKFAFNYDMPYSGRAKFHPQNMYPLQQLAVMIPPTMNFASPSNAFQVLSVGNNRYKVEAAEQLRAGQGPEFELSGTGTLPSMQDAKVHAPPKPPTGALTSPPAMTGNGTLEVRAQGGSPSESGPLHIEKPTALLSRTQTWVLGAGAVLIFGAFAFLLFRRKSSPRAKAEILNGTSQPGRGAANLVEALKEGLFQLESDRLQGVILKEEYASVKRALDRTIEWAVGRAEGRLGTAARFNPNQKSESSVLTYK